MTPNLPYVDPILVDGEIARRSLRDFIRIYWHCVEPAYEYKSHWWIDAFCDHLSNISQIKQLLVSVPPRTGKSLILGTYWPAWLLIRNPAMRFMFTSYSMDLSEAAGEKCRDLILSDPYKTCFGSIVNLDTNTCTKRHFETTAKGFRLATSCGGLATGYGADAIIVDDPHNVRQSESETERGNTIRFFTNSFFNRLNDPATGVRIVCSQRTHRNDLSGYILANSPEEWCHLCIPYDCKRPLISIGSPALGHIDPRTEEGQPLWPERFPAQEVKQYRRNRSTWETQYNQCPISTESALFSAENLRYYQETEEHYLLGSRRILKSQCVRFGSVDLAISLSESADYTVAAVADVSPFGDIILLHITRDRIAGPKIVPMLQGLHRSYNVSLFLIEDVAYQKLLVQMARQAGLPVRGVHPTSDKIARSVPLQIKSEGEQLWAPQGPAWVGVFEDELLQFPDGDRDDQVDAVAYLGAEVVRRRWQDPHAVPPVPPTEEEQRDERTKAYWAAMLADSD